MLSTLAQNLKPLASSSPFSSDSLREVGLVDRDGGEGVDARAKFEFFKRAVGLDESKVVGESIGVAREEDAGIEADRPRAESIDVVDDIRGAVVGQGIVELGVLLEFIGALEHIDKEILNLRRGSIAAVEVDIDIPDFGAEGDEIPFIADDIHEFITAEGSAGGSIDFILFEACFDGNDEMASILESKAEHGVS